MNKDLKLAEEEFIFSIENVTQNISFLKADYEKGLEPRVYEVDINGKLIKVIMLHNMTVTNLMASFRNNINFRVVLNLEEGVMLANPSSNKALITDDLALENYANLLANNIYGNIDKLGIFGTKTGKGVTNFQLWNFYNYKLYLDL